MFQGFESAVGGLKANFSPDPFLQVQAPLVRRQVVQGQARMRWKEKKAKRNGRRNLFFIKGGTTSGFATTGVKQTELAGVTHLGFVAPGFSPEKLQNADLAPAGSALRRSESLPSWHEEQRIVLGSFPLNRIRVMEYWHSADLIETCKGVPWLRMVAGARRNVPLLWNRTRRAA